MAGMLSPASRPMIEIVTNSSTKVKPFCLFRRPETLAPEEDGRKQHSAVRRLIEEDNDDPFLGQAEINSRMDSNSS